MNRDYWSQRSSPSGDYTFCCGFGSVADTFLYAGELLEGGRFIEAAREIGLAGIEQKEHTGDWLASWQRDPKRLYMGLMKGLSGVGYLYLRLYDPWRFRSFVLPTQGRTSVADLSRTPSVTRRVRDHRTRLLDKYWHHTVKAIQGPDRGDENETGGLESYVATHGATSIRRDLRRIPVVLQSAIEHLPPDRRTEANELLAIEQHRFDFDRRNRVLIARDLAYRFFNKAEFIHDADTRLRLSPETRQWPTTGGSGRFVMYVRHGRSRLAVLHGPATSVLDELLGGDVSIRALMESAPLPGPDSLKLIGMLLRENIITVIPQFSSHQSPQMTES